MCADLPAQHFLKAGAVYRLLGYTSYPELQEEQDREEWVGVGDNDVKRFSAPSQGGLYSHLCNYDGVKCDYAATVVLPHDLTCTQDTEECKIDSPRTVEVEEGIFYEYIRPACANLAFYENPKKIKMRHGSSRTYMCADPRTEDAGAVCCNDDLTKAYRYDTYLAERVTFETAQARCDADSTRTMCSHSTSVRDCNKVGKGPCSGDPYFWTTETCQLQVKITSDRKVAIVHNVPSESTPVTDHVSAETMTFFRVHWDGKIDNLLNNCNAAEACTAVPDGCLCDVFAAEEKAFDSSTPPSKDDVLSLPYGAFVPSQLGQPSLVSGRSDVWVYGGDYSKETVFEVVNDHTGKVERRKNMRSTVSLTVSPTETLSFRTPVHIMSLAEENERDAIYETEAALDQYFYHTNTAPFLAFRFAQRFGISNPTPTYIKAVVRAFKTGNYTSGGQTFGSGEYGDLAATFAAVALHSEATNTLLEADPVHGSFREPLLKLIQLMRTLEFQPVSGAPMVKLNDDLDKTIRQMAFEAPGMYQITIVETRNTPYFPCSLSLLLQMFFHTSTLTSGPLISMAT